MQEYYEEIEHAADLALMVRAQTFFGLLDQATHGMLHLMGIDIEDLSYKNKFSAIFIFTAMEDILVQGLNEILFHLETENFLYLPQEIVINGTQATIFYTGGLFVRPYQEIKALTYHQMEIIEDDAGFHTVLVFDV